MRLPAFTAAFALLQMAFSSTMSASEPSGDAAQQYSAKAAIPPVIEVWYGNDQRFGALGTPQRRVNILGSASHPTGISTLSYRLNGGTPRALSLGPDGRRLIFAGDFNIDIPFDELNFGANSVLIKAVANTGDTAVTTVTVRNLSGAVWPLPYAYAWTQLTDSVQIVDGKWSLMGGGAQILEPGYDRLFAIGDTTWGDYEATVKVTVHGIDSTSTAYDDVNGGPGLGLVVRWKGHSDTPSYSPPITQPLSGYLPFGAIGCYHWRNGGTQPQPNRWEIVIPSGTNLTIPASSLAPPLSYGVDYFFKMQVQTIAGTGTEYRFKVWEAGAAEPTAWLLTAQAPLTGFSNGSFLLMAHLVSATFGMVSVTPLPDTTPPALSNIAVSPMSTTATVTWTTDRPATGSVAYGLSGSYGSVVSNLTKFVTAHAFQLGDLQPGTTYHYAVTSAVWGGVSTTSGDLTFQTAPPTIPLPPFPVSPADGSTGNATSLTLLWRQSATATGYRVQLGTDSLFSTGIFIDDSTLTDTLKAVSGLLPGTRYYWRVSARNNSGEGSFSGVSEFVTALDIPTLTSPANGAQSVPFHPTLSWRRVTLATSYRVTVSTDSISWATPVFDDSTVADTFRVASGLLLGEKYYWRVRAHNASATGGYSATWWFATGLAMVELQSPANMSAGQPLSIQFIWRKSADATGYLFQLGTDSTFASGIIKDDSSLVDTTRYVAGLASSLVYYWHVHAQAGRLTGPMSPTWTFRTMPVLPDVVELIQPADDLGVPPDSARFIWTQSHPAVNRYCFELAFDTTFTLTSIDSSLVDTTTVVRSLVRGSTYFWHVRAGNAEGWGPFSQTRRFHVTMTGVLAHEPPLPTSCSLEQNYPNPFNPSTAIRFALPHRAHVRIAVFTMLGQQVAELVNADVDAGYHVIEFGGARLASGVYLYRMQTGNFVQTRKMCILR